MNLLFLKKWAFPFHRQSNAMDCGPACIKMIAAYYGKYYSLNTMREYGGFSKTGVSFLGMSRAAEKIGFQTEAIRLNYQQLLEHAKFPCIAHWDRNHYVVVIAAPTWFRRSFLIADPGQGKIRLSKASFLEHWSVDKGEGHLIVLKPKDNFQQFLDEGKDKLSWSDMLWKVTQDRGALVQIFFAMAVASLLQLLFPLLTQRIVDSGVYTRNFQLIYVIMAAQFILVLSRSTAEFIRTRLLQHLSILINLTIASDLWIKITRLPISYFSRYRVGDTIQRINDNKKIESFLTNSSINTFFSLFTLILFTFMLATYGFSICLVFLIGNMIYFLWIRRFLKIRRSINYQTFKVGSAENNATLQLIQGMPEIRLAGAEQHKRWEWEDLQVEVSKLKNRELAHIQYQQGGALLINQGKDILTTFLVVQLVMQGELSLGAMLAIQYIIGQLSSPVEQLVTFIQGAQDAKISMERLNEIHQMQNEELGQQVYLTDVPSDRAIVLNNVSFSYTGVDEEQWILDNLTFKIPEGKVTAIVGLSGSGKTTILKLLLKFYDAYRGTIYVGGHDFRAIRPTNWRKLCGAVIEDGYIFDDTIANNIDLSRNEGNLDELKTVCESADILSFIESLPNGFNTPLGLNGIRLSQGQKQRILIARALYKNPHYLFLDEATNALDANTEKTIVGNLNQVFVGKTVVVIAHRLSTVKNADQIIVIDKGHVVEIGDHTSLFVRKGQYYELFKNQMEASSV